MRKIFIRKLVNAASKNKKIVLVVGDLGYGVIEPFKNKNLSEIWLLISQKLAKVAALWNIIILIYKHTNVTLSLSGTLYNSSYQHKIS